MFTNASMRGLGAVWKGQVPASGFFNAANEGSDINELELLAAIHGLRAFTHFARSHELVLVSDSLVTVHIPYAIGRRVRRASSPIYGHCGRCESHSELPYLPGTCPPC
jgi:ribonuclease HI